MNQSLPPFAWPIADAAIRDAMEQAFRDGTWGVYHGPRLCEFEQQLAAWFGVSHALTCSSGTLAIQIALQTAGVSVGDEVIMAAYDYESNFLNIHELKAKPVLIDNNSAGQLDVQFLDAAKSERTKAIIASHLHGGLLDISAIRRWADTNNVLFIEDAAQAAGAMINQQPVGSFGHLSTLSFGGSKLLSAGRGGAILTNDAKKYQRAKLLLSRGVQQWAAITELQAIVLQPQLDQLKQSTQTRLNRVQQLDRLLAEAGVRGLDIFADFQQQPAFYKVGYWFDRLKFGMNRDQFCKIMRDNGVPFDPGFMALHMGRSPSRFKTIAVNQASQPAELPFPLASKLNDCCITLHHPILLSSEEMVTRMAEIIINTYRKSDQRKP